MDEQKKETCKTCGGHGIVYWGGTIIEDDREWRIEEKDICPDCTRWEDALMPPTKEL
jgi:hypothetical protein